MPRNHLATVPDPDQLEVAVAPSSPAGGSKTPPSTEAPRRVLKSRPTRALPTDRLSLEKQVDALSIYARLSVSSVGSAGADDLANGLGLVATTAGLAAGFLVEAGWLERVSRGRYTATAPLREYQQILNVSSSDLDDAKRPLAEAAQQRWFWTSIEPMLGGGAPKNTVLRALSREAGANDHGSQLALIIEWLQWLKMIRLVGETVYDATKETPASVTAPPAPPSDDVGEVDLPEAFDEATPVIAKAPPATPLAEEDEIMSFSFNVRLNGKLAMSLPDDRFQALVSLMAKVHG